jgi:hypothetical protein
MAIPKRRMQPSSVNGPEPRLILDYPYGLNENITTAPGECSEGANFDLEAFRTSFVPRSCYDLKGTAPNAGKLTGLLQLVKRDGTETTLTVNGSKAYLWDGASSFTDKGSLTTDALLRGNIGPLASTSSLPILT